MTYTSIRLSLSYAKGDVSGPYKVFDSKHLQGSDIPSIICCS